MRTLIEQLEFHAQNNPKATVLFDEQMPKGISYEELDNLSGRVYGWLKAQNIGKEDFVLINLPRGVLPAVAIIGILKDGAAFALVEDNYAPERIAYIRNDCGCKAEINRDAWEEIIKTEPLFGHENTDDHDAAYAIYTSIICHHSSLSSHFRQMPFIFPFSFHRPRLQNRGEALIIRMVYITIYPDVKGGFS